MSVTGAPHVLDDHIVGSPECPVDSMCLCLLSTSAYDLPACKWCQFAKVFIGDDANDIADRIEYGGYPLSGAYHVLLTTWKAKDGHNATLMRFIDVLDMHILWDAADSLRQRFDCRPKPIDVLILALKDLDVRDDAKKHISDNICDLAAYTNVTEGLLLKLQSKNILTSSNIAELGHTTSENKGMALYRLLAKTDFVLSDLIHVLDDDGQYKPLWILRDVYITAARMLSLISPPGQTSMFRRRLFI